MSARPGLLQVLLLHLLAGLGIAAADTLPAPGVHLLLDDNLVTINISVSQEVIHPAYATYTIALQNVNSSSETLIENNQHIHKIQFRDLLAGVLYCVRVRLNDSPSNTHTPFSEAQCFRTPSKALPENLRVEAVNTRYILKWDWDYRLNPGVTFSVEYCTEPLQHWKRVQKCENVTALECNVSGFLHLFIIHNFRVSMYNRQTHQRSSNVVRFHPLDDTVIGPPTGLTMTINNSDLYIVVAPPEGLMVESLRNRFTWLYTLEIWNNSAPSEVITKRGKTPNFRIEAVEASTTYCARAYVLRESEEKPGIPSEEKPGLPSKDFCLSTETPYVKWIIGPALVVAVAVVASVVYVCLCPLKRYMKQVFYPKCQLPSSIEKFFQDSPQNSIRNFHVPEEEPADQCIIIPKKSAEGC